ncbi:unnamed protein product [Tilletia controversa]|uniref:Peptidase M43 pregnancy-associated plasma-A domain-containing protein n=3 Tax=Tilletia TaxID=13289 RepID=A0A8X7MVJ8_9BASI|nr:hypothetical protein CF336_g3022 [Tilletia laevis]KAE8201204.1 hypothetical protein CF328_g2744 [Tilletia controversa]KAE8263331.1 hypothetical protein A4X03_0g1766 [Tilletia caries]KAE8206292.1 hypothetical protein CF335_g2002 [Tilletia laevis]KAE8248661.1 hypothetical protein A4X06_0g3581 [Tilletia controversa]
MKFTVFASVLMLGAASALADSVQGRFPARKCGTAHVDAAAEAKNQQLIKAYSQQAVQASYKRTVPVYWHTITDGSKGSLSSSQIQSQIDVLNTDFAKAGYSFHLVGSDSTLNPDWFHSANISTSQEVAMKASLHRGGANALNIYTVHTNKAIGWGTLPSDYSSAPSYDGIVINHGTLPGGPWPPAGLGRTATHEVGHWLGLYHVFDGGCTGNGDFVDDTPAQATQTEGCPSFQDSCPGGGVDSIHNFMDYSDDACVNQFTKGQIMRMHAMSRAYRGI